MRTMKIVEVMIFMIRIMLMEIVMISGSTRKDMCTARGLEAIDGLKLLVFTSYLFFFPFASTLNNKIMTWYQK